MLLDSEIRAFYIKSTSKPLFNHATVDKLWAISRHLPIISIDLTKNFELIIHSAISMDTEAWEMSVRLARQYCLALNAKSGYIFVRHVLAKTDSLALSTEVEAYKITRRGLYLSKLPELPSLLEDIIRYSGNVKRHQQIELMGSLFKFIEGIENNTD